VKINLSSHVVAQVVGDELLLLDSTTQGVYSLALSDVVDHSEGFQSLTVSEAAEGVAASLCEQGLATAETAGLSRRALVGTGSAVLGAGLLALSLPTAAAASSPGGGSASGLRITTTNGSLGFNEDEFFVFVTGDVQSATSASLSHTFPTSFIATSPITPTEVAGNLGNFDSGRGTTLFRFPQTSGSSAIPAGEWTMTLTYTLPDDSTGTMTATRQAI